MSPTHTANNMQDDEEDVLMFKSLEDETPKEKADRLKRIWALRALYHKKKDPCVLEEAKNGITIVSKGSKVGDTHTTRNTSS